MATAHPKLALRPFLPADTPLLAEIFRAAIAGLTGDDYSEAQQEAWASVVEDEAEFGQDLAGELAINTSLTGIPYWGTDIGGFVPTSEFTAELYLRWFQFGAFCNDATFLW